MQHYWGAKAICERLGLKDHRRLPILITRNSLPAYRRRMPGKAIAPYYSNSDLIARWELAKALDERERLLAKLESNR
jgi:hypothetical protein